MPLTASPAFSSGMPAIFPTDYPRVIESEYVAPRENDVPLPVSRTLSYVLPPSPRVIEASYALTS